jgi:hypothetical protein
MRQQQEMLTNQLNDPGRTRSRRQKDLPTLGFSGNSIFADGEIVGNLWGPEVEAVLEHSDSRSRPDWMNWRKLCGGAVMAPVLVIFTIFGASE